MAVPSPVGDVKIVSPISTFVLYEYVDTQIKCFFYLSEYKVTFTVLLTETQLVAIPALSLKAVHPRLS